jgi:hypothetical protein
MSIDTSAITPGLACASNKPLKLAPSRIKIDEDRDVVVSSACGGLIDAHTLARRDRMALVGFARVVGIDMLDSLRVETQLLSHRGKAVMQPHQIHHAGLEEQREAGLLPCEGDLQGVPGFRLLVLENRQARVQEAPVLKQLQGFLLAFVVAVEPVLSTGPIGFLDAEVDVNFATGFVFFDTVDEEGCLDGQKRGEFADDLHVLFSA